MSTETIPKSSYHHGDLRYALVDAATNLVKDYGPELFSMADACRAAGVSKAAPYRHFDNKEALLRAVCEQGFERFGTRMEIARRGLIPGSNKRISAIGMAYIEFAIEEPAIFKLMFGNSIQVDTHKRDPTADRPRFQILLEEIVTRTNHRSVDKLIQIAFPLWTLVHGASMLILDNSYERIHPDTDIESMIKRSTALLLANYPEK